MMESKQGAWTGASSPRRRARAVAALVGASGVLAASLVTADVAVAQPADSTTFSIIQVPDTQMEVSTTAGLLANRYQWIADHRESDDIRFVVQTGDLVNWGVKEPVQFERASAATEILDRNRIPYSYAIGNHDGAAVDVGGAAAPGDVYANLRDTRLFNTTFPVSRFQDVGGVFEPGKMDNMYQTFSAKGTDWLVLSLEMWPRSEAIAWARGVVEAHPEHNVIINTHANVDGNGARPIAGMYGSNDAQALWDQLGSQYANIRMILSGHYGGRVGAYYDEVKGVHGNTVVQSMTAYHSANQNHLRKLTIDVSAMTVSSEVLVPKAINGQPQGKIVDAYSDFTVQDMAFVRRSELLSDPGFESGSSDWIPFVVGDQERVTSPVHGGSYAMKVTSPNPLYGLTGMTQNDAMVDTVAGQEYTASCYVRPTRSGMEVYMQLAQYARDYSSHEYLNTTLVQKLPANEWTQVTVTATATDSGQRMIPQIFGVFQTKNTGYLVYDDCSFS